MDDDSRGLAVVDWDLDGDLDLWMSGRTAPRLRFFKNNTPHDSGFISLRLGGTKSNRDGIGARVEVVVEGASIPPLMKTLRAGEGYLSQSSKWLHFALPKAVQTVTARVRWPEGGIEDFSGIAVNQHYRLMEDRGEAVRVDRGVVPAIQTGDQVGVAISDTAKIVPHARMPLPSLYYQDESGREQPIDGGEHRVLVVLWASWCAPCLAELQALSREQERLTAAGIRVIPVNVEDINKPSAERLQMVNRVFRRHRLSWDKALGTTDLVEVLDAVQRSIIGRQAPLPVPCSFLLNSEGDLLAIYKGERKVEDLLMDLSTLEDTSRLWRDNAVPLAGRWYVNAFGPDAYALPEKFIELGNASAASSYLRRHLPVGIARSAEGHAGHVLSTAEQAERDGRIGRLYRLTGKLRAAEANFDQAVDLFRAALIFEPDSYESKKSLAVALQSQGDYASAVTTYETLIRLQPDDLLVLNSYSWILATAGEASIRNAERAIALATRACEQTNFQSAEAVDTLAAAWAAAGNFEKAVELARQALSLAESAGNQGLVPAIRQRLASYGKGESIVRGLASP